MFFYNLLFAFSFFFFFLSLFINLFPVLCESFFFALLLALIYFLLSFFDWSLQLFIVGLNVGNLLGLGLLFLLKNQPGDWVYYWFNEICFSLRNFQASRDDDSIPSDAVVMLIMDLLLFCVIKKFVVFLIVMSWTDSDCDSLIINTMANDSAEELLSRISQLDPTCLGQGYSIPQVNIWHS